MSTRMLTVNQVAKTLNVTRATVYAMMNRGELPYTLVGKRRRIDEIDVMNYLEKNRKSGSVDSEPGPFPPRAAAA